MTDQPPQLPRHRQQRDLPARLGESIEAFRMRLGTSRILAGTAATAAMVLLVAVTWAVLAADDGGGQDPSTSVAQTGDVSPSAPRSPVLTPSPSASPSETESPEPTEDEPTSAAEEPTTTKAEETKEEPEQGLPADGHYQVVQDASGLCMSTGPEPGNESRTVVVLGDCGSAYPSSLQWSAWDEGVYAVSMDFSNDDWQACMGVDAPGDQSGYLVAGYGCEFTETQFFELKPAGGGKYLIENSAAGLCLGILSDASSNAGTAIATADCDSEEASQRWTFS
ncbi:RICIN domain-containing protein [Glycomyces buryatensis]|uniref:Ricin B lectin domain-containing protein n=1 Tax=Glycomyces buryatensis TaxID=2570927 RepID=A0A4S8QBE5_9ACTN|nr:ricin-type beta-trefoil lectin domain protein [Glycomyces buryatensis]THV40135.1 hypothetical protein FAB82_15670 [Glycomyces buryatensis]